MSGGVKGDVIHSYIVAAGDPGVRAMIQGTIGTDWSLSLCLGHPAFAAVSYRTGNQVETVVFGDRTSTGRSQRLITLPFRARRGQCRLISFASSDASRQRKSHRDPALH